MDRRLLLVLTVAAVLAGCGPVPRPQPVSHAPVVTTAGLERVMGRDARTLQLLFGAADQDVREYSGRRLQFVGAACVLDAYLYPPAQGSEPVVSHIDARLPNGDDFDRASCIAALSRRKEAR